MIESEKPDQETLTLIEPFIERLGNYTKTNYQLVKLKTIGKSAEVVSVFVARGFVIIAFFMFTLILSLGLSFWIGSILNNTSYGFFCVASFYGLLGLSLYFLLHKRIKRHIHNHIISQLLN